MSDIAGIDRPNRQILLSIVGQGTHSIASLQFLKALGWKLREVTEHTHRPVSSPEALIDIIGGQGYTGVIATFARRLDMSIEQQEQQLTRLGRIEGFRSWKNIFFDDKEEKKRDQLLLVTLKQEIGTHIARHMNRDPGDIPSMLPDDRRWKPGCQATAHATKRKIHGVCRQVHRTCPTSYHGFKGVDDFTSTSSVDLRPIPTNPNDIDVVEGIFECIVAERHEQFAGDDPTIRHLHDAMHLAHIKASTGPYIPKDNFASVGLLIRAGSAVPSDERTCFVENIIDRLTAKNSISSWNFLVHGLDWEKFPTGDWSEKNTSAIRDYCRKFYQKRTQQLGLERLAHKLIQWNEARKIYNARRENIQGRTQLDTPSIIADQRDYAAPAGLRVLNLGSNTSSRVVSEVDGQSRRNEHEPVDGMDEDETDHHEVLDEEHRRWH